MVKGTLDFVKVRETKRGSSAGRCSQGLDMNGRLMNGKRLILKTLAIQNALDLDQFNRFCYRAG